MSQKHKNKNQLKNIAFNYLNQLIYPLWHSSLRATSLSVEYHDIYCHVNSHSLWPSCLLAIKTRTCDGSYFNICLIPYFFREYKARRSYKELSQANNPNVLNRTNSGLNLLHINKSALLIQLPQLLQCIPDFLWWISVFKWDKPNNIFQEKNKIKEDLHKL